MGNSFPTFGGEIDYKDDPLPSPPRMASYYEVVREIRGSVELNEEELSKDFKNYGIIPLNVIHHVMKFLPLRNLPNSFVVCKLFNRCGNCHFFWKQYYSNYFRIETPQVQRHVNWKKRFYQELRSTYFSDEFYRRKYTLFEISERNRRKKSRVEKMKLQIGIFGDFMSGKTSILHTIIGGKFGEYEHVDEATARPYTFVRKQISFDKRNEETKKEVKVTFWDTFYPGFVTNNEFMYRQCDGFLVTFLLDNTQTFGSCLLKIKKLLELKGPSAMVVVGMKSDIEEERKEMSRDFVEESLSIFDDQISEKIVYIEASAKDGINCYKSFGMLCDLLLKMKFDLYNEREDSI